MAKMSQKMGGKEVGSAAVYAPPHTMTGKSVQAPLPVTSPRTEIDDLNPSAGMVSKGNYKPIKTDGIQMRGTGCATKGLMSRGPMA